MKVTSKITSKELETLRNELLASNFGPMYDFQEFRFSNTINLREGKNWITTVCRSTVSDNQLIIEGTEGYAYFVAALLAPVMTHEQKARLVNKFPKQKDQIFKALWEHEDKDYFLSLINGDTAETDDEFVKRYISEIYFQTHTLGSTIMRETGKIQKRLKIMGGAAIFMFLVNTSLVGYVLWTLLSNS